MGLDTTHDCWHGGYYSFMAWRKKLAEVAGWGDLEKYDGYYGDREYPAPETDALTVLMNHSDCDGEIAAEWCGPLADRLAELLPLLPEEDAGVSGHLARRGWRGTTQKFIDGLRAAAAAGEPVEFH